MLRGSYLSQSRRERRGINNHEKTIEVSEKNYIFDELNEKVRKEKGIFKDEGELFREMLEFEKQRQEAHPPTPSPREGGKKIIDFFPVADNDHARLPMKLAAESGIQETQQKSDFLLSGDGKFAIKYSQKENNEIHLMLLADAETNTDDVILYSPKLNKYFISNLDGDFVIGQYSVFDFSQFDFKAIMPLDKIVILKKDNSFSTFSQENSTQPEIPEIAAAFLRLKINAPNGFVIAVLSTSKTRDFLTVQNGIVEIPMMLIDDKGTILVY
jgi:hypothetical protein